MNLFADPDAVQSGVAVIVERDADDMDIMIAVWPKDVDCILSALRSIVHELEEVQRAAQPHH